MRLFDKSTWEANKFPIALFGQSIDFRSAGIAQSQNFRRFIKGFPYRIIPGAANYFIL